MEDFAQLLRSWSGGWVTSRVVDATEWDLDLKFSARNLLSRAGSEGISLPTALEQQLGLKVTPAKLPGPVLIVDRVNERPTENPSGVAQALPAPPPAEFDVADIKLSAPDVPFGGRIQPMGRADFQGATLKVLVYIAWDVRDDDLVVGWPKWSDTTKYSLVAKTSAVSGTEGVPVDIDDFRLMLRSLLVERFQLRTHIEDRPVAAYRLVVADKPRLERADPANRTNWINGPAPGSRDPRDSNPALNRLVTVQNMTMAQFAEDLSAMASGYLKEPVVDATGLSGAWDFALSFSGVNLLQPAPPGAESAPSDPTLGASTPNGALSLFDALPKQLGLKLERHLRPFPVLVIDHVEERPTEN